jgi:hypothetical protein
MKPLKKKLSDTDWLKNLMKRWNYNKFVKKTLNERRKQLNIHFNGRQKT